jgi:hypothetical protein
VKTQGKEKKKSATKREGAAKSLSPRTTLMLEASPDLIRDLRQLIEQARGHIAQAVNSVMLQRFNIRLGKYIDAHVDPTLSTIIQRPLRSSYPQNILVLNHSSF